MTKKRKLFDSLTPKLKENEEILPIENIDTPMQVAELEPNILEDLGEPHPITVDYMVRVNCVCLKSFYKPNSDSAIHSFLFENTEHHICGEMNGWGQLDNNSWIKLEYTIKI